MAYKLTYNHLKNGDTTYYIKSISRIPGKKDKFKEMIVSKYSENELLEKGYNVKEFLDSKLAELRSQPKVSTRFADFKVNMNQFLSLSDVD